MPKVVAIVAVFLYVGLLFADHHPAWAGWKDLSPSESRIGFTGGVYGGALPFQAEENEGKDVSSELAVFGVADQFGAVVYSRLTNNKARWNDHSASKVIKNWQFLSENKHEKKFSHSATINNYQIRYQVLDVYETQRRRGCFVFFGIRRHHRLEGFFCEEFGVEMTRSSVETLVGQLTIPGVIGP
jgi:hypothetical protein